MQAYLQNADTNACMHTVLYILVILGTGYVPYVANSHVDRPIGVPIVKSVANFLYRTKRKSQTWA